MSEAVLADVLGWTGTILQVARGVPALITLWREKDPAPGNDVTMDLLLVSGIWWVVYSIEIDNVFSLVACALGVLPPAVALFLLFRRHSVHLRGAALLIVGVALLPLALISSRDAAVVAAALGAFIAVPEAFKMLTQKEPVTGSLGTWLIITAGAIIWLVYGVLIGHVLVGAAGLVQLPCTAVIMWRILRDRRRAPAPLSA